MPLRNNPFFSIVIPAYNVEEYISECIESVLTQSFQDFELILVDDGSTDRTGEICDEYVKKCQKTRASIQPPEQYQKGRAEHDKNQPHTPIIAHSSEKVNSKVVKVIHQANSGLSVARNTGVKAASGEYLLFLDGDDYLEPDAFAGIKRGIDPGASDHDGDSDIHLDLLRFQAQEVFLDGKITKYPEPGFATTTGIEAFHKISQYHYVENAWLYAYRREFFVKNQFQYAVGCVAEDFGLTPLILARAEAVKSISDICYDYRQRSGSITRGASSIRQRTTDIQRQLETILPQIAEIPETTPILHFLVVSFLTGATALNLTDFLQYYQHAKHLGWLKYIHPVSLKSLPRAFILKHFPRIFYHLYRQS